jgi:transposase
MTKTDRLTKALTGKTLSKSQIASRFNISNVSAFINDIRRKGINVRLTSTRNGNTAYTI